VIIKLRLVVLNFGKGLLVSSKIKKVRSSVFRDTQLFLAGDATSESGSALLAEDLEQSGYPSLSLQKLFLCHHYTFIQKYITSNQSLQLNMTVVACVASWYSCYGCLRSL